MKNEDNPCYGCKERFQGCYLTCKKGIIVSIKRELERRKKVRYMMKYSHWATEGERKRATKNLKWHGILKK